MSDIAESSAGIVVALGVATLPFAGSSAGQWAVPASQVLISSTGAQQNYAGHFVAAPQIVVEDRAVEQSPAELLVAVRKASGLTWDQLARYFGVSRRSVHLWAAGGRMSATNEELLAHLTQAVEQLRDLEPKARRQALLRSDSGLNIIDAERVRRSSRDTDINRSPDIRATADLA